MHHHTWLIFVFLLEIDFHHVGQAGLELLDLSASPAVAFQTAAITGVNHHAGFSSHFSLFPSFFGRWKCVIYQLFIQ